MDETNSLFNKLGGSTAVDAAVDIFYDKVLADESISHFFTNLNMRKQRVKQKAFLSYAFGCPMAYTGKSMREAHAHLNLTEDHFNAVATHLVDTLNELQVPQDLIDHVVEVAVSTKDDVLGN